MPLHLSRLGRSAFRNRVWFMLAWVAIAAAACGIGLSVNNIGHGAALTVPSTESQEARDMLATEFPDASGAGGTIILRAPEGSRITAPQYSSQVRSAERKAAGIEGVRSVTGPAKTGAISADGRSALVVVQFEEQSNEVSTDAKDEYRAISGRYGDVTVAAGGEVAAEDPAAGGTEVLGVAVAAVVLVITFGSLVAAGMTLATALVGVAAGMGGVLIMSHFVDFTTVTPILALMLGLAVGIDYALFIFSRFRQELLKGAEPEQAAGIATGTAGSAVVFAGLTVIIALAGLSLVGVPFLRTMGLMGALAVLVAIIAAITLVPAMAGFSGDRILSQGERPANTPRRGVADVREKPMGRRWAELVTSHPGVSALLSMLVLCVCALPAADMQLALPSNGGAPADSSARQAYDMVSESFGVGYNAQIVIVQQDDSAANVRRDAAQLSAQLRTHGEGVAAVGPASFSKDGRTAITTLVPTTGPSDERTADLVNRIRDDVRPEVNGSMKVTGATAVGIDVSHALSDALPIYLAVVVGLSLVLLTLVFRSLLVPLKAAFGFILSIGATLGATTAVFQWGWLSFIRDGAPTSPIVSFMPILLVGVLFGLSMDYEVFIVSRIREEFIASRRPRQSIVDGFAHSARVVTAAATIMIAVFLGFTLSSDISVKSMGFALAVGVLFDAFLVRMTLVPALLTLMGRHAWALPGWLSRRLPNMDIEGASLQEVQVDEAAPADAAAPSGSEDKTPALVQPMAAAAEVDLSPRKATRPSSSAGAQPVALLVRHGGIVEAREDDRGEGLSERDKREMQLLQLLETDRRVIDHLLGEVRQDSR